MGDTMTATKPKDEQETYYWPNGSVREILNHRNGTRHGRTTLYWANGSVWAIYHYQNGKYHGRTTFFGFGGSVGAVLNHRNGKLHGPQYGHKARIEQ